MPMEPTRRRVMMAGAGTAAALLGPSFAPAASAAPKSSGASGLQPYASYWFPDSLPAGEPGDGIVWRSLKRWTPEGDRDLAFNRASVPLAARFTPVPANATARTDQARITSLVAFDHTAGNPSQGSATADYYALSNWAYIDELVFWGGSAGEGLVLAPNAPVVDAAHRNGVRVLGTVFLPPVGHGGDLRWTRDLVRQDAFGRFPIAEQLVRVAVAHGFDGWFINAETGGGDAALAQRMLGFVKALRAGGAAKGLRVTWYDAMNATGEVGWQGALDSVNQEFFQDGHRKVADSMFLDFRWTPRTLADSGRLADGLGRSRYELWAGVDVESDGWNSTVDWDAIVPREGSHIVSLGLYRPEWTLNHLPADRTPAQFHAADDRFWTGESLDPAHPEGTWRAPAGVVADRSTVTALPFATSFNTGHGLRWYDEGAVTSPEAWNHLALQDRLPGRRWEARTDGRRPAVSLDFDDAWRGGGSLLVDGALDAPVTVGLYATRLPLGGRTVVELTHRVDAGSGPVDVELAVALGEPHAPGAPLPYRYIPAGTVRAGGWSTTALRLSSLGRGTVHALGVRLTGRDGSPVRWRLGALAVHEGVTRPHAPSGLRVTDAVRAGGAASLRLSWRRAPGGDAGRAVRHYELHRVLPDGRRLFLGGTCGTAFHLPSVSRAAGERAARFELRAVGELYTSSGPAPATYTW